MSTFISFAVALAAPSDFIQALGDFAAGCVLLCGLWFGCLEPVLSHVVRR